MGQAHDRDPEKEIDKIEAESPSSEDGSLPSRPPTAITKEPDITAIAAPPSNVEDILKLPERGRTDSHSSRSSDDSQRTQSDAHDHQVTTHQRSRSRISRAQSSVRSIRPDAVKVPRSHRRGLLARFCLIDEVTNAWDYPRRMKWTVTFIVAVAGAAAPMGSSIILPALVDIARDFHSTATIVNLSVAMYMLSMSIFPLWWSSFSETLGRRTIYVTSFALFLVFNILSAVSTSIGMFVVMRILSGGAAASVQAVGAGTIADVWEVKERGKAMGMFYLGPLCGPLLSPILGGVLAQTLGWRSAQWFLAIFGGVLFFFIIFCLPETLRQRVSIAAEAEEEAVADVTLETDEKSAVRPPLNRTSTKQSVHLKSKKYLVMARRALIDPLHIILYLQFPAVAILVLYASITFGSLYVLNISVQQTFSAAPYHYGSIIVGCLYIPNSLGYFLSSIFGGRWVDQIMHREARKAGRFDDKGRLKFIPEDRMKENAWVAAVLFPCSLIAYGWFAEEKINVAAALVANFFFGIGSMLIFALVTTMLTEFMPRKASNGIALNNFVRNIFSCVGGVVTEPLIVAIGNGWLFFILGVASLIAGPLTIWSMKRFGPGWRKNMDQRMEQKVPCQQHNASGTNARMNGALNTAASAETLILKRLTWNPRGNDLEDGYCFNKKQMPLIPDAIVIHRIGGLIYQQEALARLKQQPRAPYYDLAALGDDEVRHIQTIEPAVALFAQREEHASSQYDRVKDKMMLLRRTRSVEDVVFREVCRRVLKAYHAPEILPKPEYVHENCGLAHDEERRRCRRRCAGNVDGKWRLQGAHTRVFKAVVK